MGCTARCRAHSRVEMLSEAGGLLAWSFRATTVTVYSSPGFSPVWLKVVTVLGSWAITPPSLFCRGRGEKRQQEGGRGLKTTEKALFSGSTGTDAWQSDDPAMHPQITSSSQYISSWRCRSLGQSHPPAVEHLSCRAGKCSRPLSCLIPCCVLPSEYSAEHKSKTKASFSCMAATQVPGAVYVSCRGETIAYLFWIPPFLKYRD